MNQAVFNQIYQECQQISPYLKGEFTDAESESNSELELISANRSNITIIKSLHTSLMQQSPEAGRSYWLTRSWELLTWQPLYLTLTSIYQLRILPDLNNMLQQHDNGLVAGFRFNCTDCATGDYECLIRQAGKQLSQLFEHYRKELDQWARCRPRFTEHLIADALFAKLLLMQKSHPEMSDSFIRRHAKLWLDALNFSDSHLQSLCLSKLDNKLSLNRTSCCCVYKTTAGVKCANCPRLKQKSKSCTN